MSFNVLCGVVPMCAIKLACFYAKTFFFNNINRLLGTRIRVICASKVAELSYKSMPFV